MYAIVRTGGKQYRVAPGDVLYFEQLNAPVGEAVRLDDVLLVAGEGPARVGLPRVADSAVLGTVLEQGRERKIRVFKCKRRKHYRRTKGHRQPYTAVRIDKIEA